MITEIGITAGDIWHYLDKQDKAVGFSRLCAGINKPNDLVLMSLGWLAREGHIILNKESEGYQILLRRP